MKIVAIDTETKLIDYTSTLPEMVCFQWGSVDETPQVMLACDPRVHSIIKNLLEDPTVVLVGVNLAFDLGVIASNFPDLLPHIWLTLSQGRALCCSIREALIALSTGGSTQIYYSLDGQAIGKVGLGMADMLKRYTGKDISLEKQSSQSWRTNYYELKDTPIESWPPDAIKYAQDDITHTLSIYLAQEDAQAGIIKSVDIDPFKTLKFRCNVDFCLKLLTSWGNEVDPVYLRHAYDKVKKATDISNFPLLLERGIVERAVEPMPLKNKAKAHVAGCPSVGKKTPCDCPLKMKKAVPEKLSKKTLIEYIKYLSQQPESPIKLEWKKEDKSRTQDISEAKILANGKTSEIVTDSEWMEEYAQFDETLQQYQKRQSEIKLLTSYIPKFYINPNTKKPYNKTTDGSDPYRFCVPSPVIRSDFSVLKNTGRTSSWGGKAYPSQNGQQVDPRIRGVIVPRKGYWLFSLDYSGMELGTLAQTCISKVGYSVLADKLNAGVNAHSYLGAQIAWELNGDFNGKCNTSDAEKIYDVFMSCEGSDEPCDFSEFTSWYSSHKNVSSVSLGDFFKHYRSFAKPTGLGFPGGLGVSTFCNYAKATYGIELDEPTAKKLKSIWLKTYPEMRDYFTYITTNCQDEYSSTPDETKYRYTTPFGMTRPACNYTAACNGMGLQSPSAEGALLGLYAIVQSIHTKTSVLSDVDGEPPKVRPTLFIHDEIFGEVRPDVADECITAMMNTMVGCMNTVTPDVKASAEPAVMSERWSKAAFEYRVDGKIRPWEESDHYINLQKRKTK